MGLFNIVDEVTGRECGQSGVGEENEWENERLHGLCGQDEDMDQWTNKLASMEAVVTLTTLSLVRQGRRGEGMVRAGTLC